MDVLKAPHFCNVVSMLSAVHDWYTGCLGNVNLMIVIGSRREHGNKRYIIFPANETL